jgi:hypothetical protein
MIKDTICLVVNVVDSKEANRGKEEEGGGDEGRKSEEGKTLSPNNVDHLSHWL